jgi:hypothetical protein
VWTCGKLLTDRHYQRAACGLTLAWAYRAVVRPLLGAVWARRDRGPAGRA